MRDAPTFDSLFAGIGGFDLALERAGFRCVGQVEVDDACQRVLALRWPDVPRWGDVRTLWADEPEGRTNISPAGSSETDFGWLHPAAGGIDLLVGGFPCQDFSVAGKRAGLDGYRGTLFWEIVRLAKELKPTWGLFENVPGLLSSRGGRDFWVVLQGLRECWPAVSWRILDSRWFGVPQRRRRVFLVCGPDEARVTQVLFEPEGGGGDSQASGEAGARVARSLAVGASGPGYRYDPNGEEFVIADTLNSGGNSGGFRTEPGAHLVPAIGFAWQSGGDVRLNPKEEESGLSANQIPAVAYQQHGTNVGEMGTLRKGDGGLTSGVPFVAATIKQRMRGATDEVMDNLVVGAMAVRRITPTECARLQGFPDGWCCLCQPLEAWAADPETAAERCRCPDSPQYRAYGNAVTVNVIFWLASRLRRVIGGRRLMDAMTVNP